MGRRFNRSQRVSLYIAKEGRCAICGQPLGRGWHADHVRPYSQGGSTELSNGQPLCPSCNQQKGPMHR